MAVDILVALVLEQKAFPDLVFPESSGFCVVLAGRVAAFGFIDANFAFWWLRFALFIGVLAILKALCCSDVLIDHVSLRDFRRGIREGYG
jgi:hypothetical protein